MASQLPASTPASLALRKESFKSFLIDLEERRNKTRQLIESAKKSVTQIQESKERKEEALMGYNKSIESAYFTEQELNSLLEETEELKKKAYLGPTPQPSQPTSQPPQPTPQQAVVEDQQPSLWPTLRKKKLIK